MSDSQLFPYSLNLIYMWNVLAWKVFNFDNFPIVSEAKKSQKKQTVIFVKKAEMKTHGYFIHTLEDKFFKGIDVNPLFK